MTGVAHAVCTHWLNGAVCGRADASVRRYLPGWRCLAHTPSALAGHYEPVPNPDTTLSGCRAAAGLTDAVAAPMSSSALLDERAVASGRRRSSPHVYAGAHAAELERKARK